MRVLYLFPLLIASWCLCSKALAQDSTPNLWNYEASYFGNNAWTPGLKLGATYQLWEKVKTKTSKKGKEKRKSFELLAAGNLGFYSHPKNHKGFFNNYDMLIKKTSTKGWNCFAGTGMGIYRSVLPETYEVSESGEVSQVFLPGNWYFTSQILVGFGKDYLDSTAIINGWFLRNTNLFLFGYNTFTLPLLNLEAGVKINLHR